MHYIEVGEDGSLSGIYPLTEEIAGTSFYDGVLIPLPVSVDTERRSLPDCWRELTGQLTEGVQIKLVRLTGLSATAAKLGTNNGGGDCYIERL